MWCVRYLLDSMSFCFDHQDKNLPVLVKGGLSTSWTCMTSWNSNYLKEIAGHAELPARVHPSADGMFGEMSLFVL